MHLTRLQNISKNHLHHWLHFLAVVQETLQLYLKSVKIWTLKISLPVNSRNKKMCLAVIWQHEWLDTVPPVSEATSGWVASNYVYECA